MRKENMSDVVFHEPKYPSNEVIRQARADACLTCREVALRLGMEIAEFGAIERGDRFVTQQRIDSILGTIEAMRIAKENRAEHERHS